MVEEKVITKCTQFQELMKKMCQTVYAIDALKMFVNYCNAGNSVHISNPIDTHGNFDVEPQRFQPIVEEQLKQERQNAVAIAEQIKTLLDGGDFDNWNKTTDEKEKVAEEW